jgi:DNA-binding protein HU-beta
MNQDFWLTRRSEDGVGVTNMSFAPFPRNTPIGVFQNTLNLSKLPKSASLVKINNRNNTVNKTELIEHIAGKSDISKAAATRALASIIEAVKKTLKKGDTVTLVGFGTFSVSKRAARTGRNPRTGAALKIKAAKVPRFKPGKGLKDALN